LLNKTLQFNIITQNKEITFWPCLKTTVIVQRLTLEGARLLTFCLV